MYLENKPLLAKSASHLPFNATPRPMSSSANSRGSSDLTSNPSSVGWTKEEDGDKGSDGVGDERTGKDSKRGVWKYDLHPRKVEFSNGSSSATLRTLVVST